MAGGTGALPLRDPQPSRGSCSARRPAPVALAVALAAVRLAHSALSHWPSSCSQKLARAGSMLLLRLLLAAVTATVTARGSCAPKKACDFLVRMHEQCIDGPYGPIPGAPGCEPISLLCT